MARGSNILFFFKLIIPEIQHLIVRENRQHNGQKKCTIGESYMIAKLYLVADV